MIAEGKKTYLISGRMGILIDSCFYVRNHPVYYRSTVLFPETQGVRFLKPEFSAPPSSFLWSSHLDFCCLRTSSNTCWCWYVCSLFECGALKSWSEAYTTTTTLGISTWGTLLLNWPIFRAQISSVYVFSPGKERHLPPPTNPLLEVKWTYLRVFWTLAGEGDCRYHGSAWLAGGRKGPGGLTALYTKILTSYVCIFVCVVKYT